MTEVQFDFFIWGLFIFGCALGVFIMWREYIEEMEDGPSINQRQRDIEFAAHLKRRD